MRKKRRYIEYDYEEEYTEPIENANDNKIEKLLQLGKIKSVYCTKTIKAGTQFEVEIYPAYTKKESELYNVKKRNKLIQKNLNDKNARKKVQRLINANFKDGDLYITLTYDDKHLPKSMEEALKNMKNYIRRINYKRKKIGLKQAKYIYVTEFDENKKIRFHHHLIIDGDLAMDIVESTWKFGKWNKCSRTAPDEEGLSKLASYLVKDPKGKKRWCSSKNLKKPIETKTYTVFRARHVKKMVENREQVKNLLEKRFKTKKFIKEEIKFNEINGRFYIYARMIERSNQ